MPKEGLLRAAMRAQANELTEALVYERLAKNCRNQGNAKVLSEIAACERAHAAFWAQYSGQAAKPRRCTAFAIYALARVLGLNFALRLMERGEGQADKSYSELAAEIPGLAALAKDEAEHETQLLGLLDEEKLAYIGSIVLGLNDALVELTGALAGFTLALADTRYISLAGLVTGISAAFSMAASDYLSSKAAGDSKAAKSALYTGLAYLVTVAILILPFLLMGARFVALGITLASAVLIIAGFNYYISVAQGLGFRRRFLEMTLISLGVAGFSFGLGFLLKRLLGIET